MKDTTHVFDMFVVDHMGFIKNQEYFYYFIYEHTWVYFQCCMIPFNDCMQTF